MPFTTYFPWPNAHDGNVLECWHEGFHCVASIVYDNTAQAPDKWDEGFWPSLDPKDHSFMGFKLDNGGPRDRARLRRATKQAQAVYDAWLAQEWCYVGVVVEVFADGAVTEKLGDASLWGVECNYPNKRAKNMYLTVVANEMLSEAIDAARANPSYPRHEFEVRMRAAQKTTMPATRRTRLLAA